MALARPALLYFSGAALPATSTSLSALLALAGFPLFQGCLRGGEGGWGGGGSWQRLSPCHPWPLRPSLPGINLQEPLLPLPHHLLPKHSPSAGASEDPGFGGSLSGGSGSPARPALQATGLIIASSTPWH